LKDLLLGRWLRGASLSRSINVAWNTDIELEKLITGFAQSSRDVMEIQVRIGTVGWRDADISYGHEHAHIVTAVVYLVFKSLIVPWNIFFAEVEIHVARVEVEMCLVVLCRIRVMIVAMISTLA
jgi:hypothetical protein